MPISALALGCQLKSKAHGIIYTKTGPEQWEPSTEGLSFGWQPFTATDEAVLTNKNFLPKAMRGRNR